jgi:hypothetical protein
MTGLALRAGLRLRSVTCAAQVIVVRAPSGVVDLRCGGLPMTTDAAEQPPHAMDHGLATGSVLGKRYTDGAGLEVLVTKAGDGTLSVGAEPLAVQDPKRLPSSD